MAKDGKNKKKAKAKLPKEIGGVKVPKKLRKIGNKAVKLAKEPVVSEMVAGALLAAAAALREGTGAKPAAAAGDAVEGARRQAGRLGDSLKGIAIDFARRTLDNLEGGGRKGKAGKSGGGSGGGEV